MVVKRYCFYVIPEHAQEVRNEKLYTSRWCGGEGTTGEKKLVDRKASIIIFDFLL